MSESVREDAISLFAAASASDCTFTLYASASASMRLTDASASARMVRFSASVRAAIRSRSAVDWAMDTSSACWVSVFSLV